jgi:hypothetical protein
MFSKEELKQYKIDFWTAFKKRMQDKRSSNGRKINWLNYPSEIPYIFIRLDANAKEARFMIDIQPKDDGIRAIIWEQLYELKVVFEAEMGTDGQWLENESSQQVAAFNRISWMLEDVNFFQENDKHKIFDFFEERLVKFDNFYQEFKDILIHLAS